MFNRFELYGEPTPWNLPKVDLEVLAGVLEAKQKRFDTGYALADELGKKSIDSLASQRARANAIQKEWEDKKTAIVSNYNGDYAAAYRELDKLRMDMEKQLGPGGEANALITQKKVFMDKYEAMSKDKEVNPQSVNAWMNYYTSPESQGYIGEMKQDPVTGAWNVVTPEDIIPMVNPNDIVLPAIKELEADGYEFETDQISGQWIMRKKGSTETLSMEDVYKAAYSSLINDPKYLASLEQDFRFKGITDMDANLTAQAMAMDYANTYAYNKTSESSTIRPNEIWMHNDKEARKDKRDKDMFEQMNQLYWGKGTLDYGAIGSQPNELTLSSINLERSLQYPSMVSGIPGMATSGKSQVGGFKSNSSITKADLAKKIYSGEFAKAGHDASLMTSILKDNPSANVEEAIQLYNEATKQAGYAYEPSFVTINDPETAKNIATQLIKGGDYTRAKMTFVGGPNERPVDLSPAQKDSYIKKILETMEKSGTELPTPAFMDASNGMRPSFQFPVGPGQSIFIEAPAWYTRQFDDVTELSSAKDDSNRVKELPNGFIAPVSFQTMQGEITINPGIPIRNVNQTRKNPRTGQYEKVDQMYAYDKDHDQWLPLNTVADNYDGTREEVPLTPSFIEGERKKALLPRILGIRTEQKDASFMTIGGNRFRIED